MIKLDIIDDNKDINSFYLRKYFYHFIIVNNQNIFDDKREIE